MQAACISFSFLPRLCPTCIDARIEQSNERAPSSFVSLPFFLASLVRSLLRLLERRIADADFVRNRYLVFALFRFDGRSRTLTHTRSVLPQSFALCAAETHECWQENHPRRRLPWAVRAGPAVASLVGLIAVAVGGFSSCRLFVGTVGEVPYAAGYLSEEMNGSCASNEVLGKDPSGTERRGLALLICATVGGSLWFLVAALAVAMKWAAAPSGSGSGAAAVAAALAFAISAASVAAAFLGLSTEHCQWYACTPGGMAYLVVFGAACWVGAGILMCWVSHQLGKQQQEQQEEEEKEADRT